MGGPFCDILHQFLGFTAGDFKSTLLLAKHHSNKKNTTVIFVVYELKTAKLLLILILSSAFHFKTFSHFLKLV